MLNQGSHKLFLTVVGPLSVDCYTLLCPCIFVALDATYEVGFKVLEGRPVRPKRPGYETRTKELLGRMEENCVSSDSCRYFALKLIIYLESLIVFDCLQPPWHPE